MKPLTKSQQKIYDFLKSEMAKGVPPTVREICNATGLSSTSTVHTQLKTLEKFVNDAIERAIDVKVEEMSVEDAKKSGAVGVFDNKYGEVVKVYTIGDVSKEICGGPHAQNTKDLHHLKIVKEESSSSGIRRIKAVLD